MSVGSTHRPRMNERLHRPSIPSAPPDAPAAVVRILLEVTTALTSLLDVDQVLGEMLTRSVRLASATAGTIILVDAKGRAQRKIAVRNDKPYEVDELTLSRVLERGLARWVFEAGVPAKVDDTHDDPRWLRIDNNGQSSRSAVCLPVWRRKRILGILTLTHSRPNHFDDDLLELLEAIAGQAGIAIENAQLFGEVQRLATTDPLTDLSNRRHFIERAEAAFRSPVRPVSAVMIDVDHFKTVNDERGHLAGDAVLVEIAHRIRDCVGDAGPLGRFGGEEFAVVLPGADLGAAVALAERVRAAVASTPIESAGGALTMTVSVGVAVAEEGAGLNELLKRADDLLYEAKHGGRDRVRF
jgi:diguanylate cyclase (GGDEF)-like protein